MSKNYFDLDLADLKAELRNAYVAKALECQIKEREAEKEIEKIRQNYDSNIEKIRHLEFTNDTKERNMELLKNREMYKKELEEQIEEKKQVELAKEEEATKERKLLEKADRYVDDEDRRIKFERKKELAERLQRDKKIFEEIKMIRKRVAMEIEAEETKKIEEYNEEMEKRAEELKNIEKEQKIRRQKLITRVANMLINVESKKREEEIRIAELVAEEMAWELVIQEREDELRRKRMRQQLAEDLREQMTFAQERVQRSLERDRAFAETLMKRIMEDERIERLTNEAKLRNKMLYKEDLIKLMEERERLRKLEQEKIKIEWQREKELEETKRNEICQARKELLIEHAVYVGPYVQNRSLTVDEQKIVAEVEKNIDKFQK